MRRVADAVRRLRRVVHHRCLLLERELTEPTPVSPGIAVDVRLLEPTQLPAYLAFQPSATERVTAEWMLAGHVCLAAWAHGRIVHAIWTATGRCWVYELGCELALEPDDIYGFWAVTDPAVRGCGIGLAVEVERVRLFRARGYRRAVTLIAPDNARALRGAELAGYRARGVIGYVGVPPLRWHYRRPVNVGAAAPCAPP